MQSVDLTLKKSMPVHLKMQNPLFLVQPYKCDPQSRPLLICTLSLVHILLGLFNFVISILPCINQLHRSRAASVLLNSYPGQTTLGKMLLKYACLLLFVAFPLMRRNNKPHICKRDSR